MKDVKIIPSSPCRDIPGSPDPAGPTPGPPRVLLAKPPDLQLSKLVSQALGGHNDIAVRLDLRVSFRLLRSNEATSLSQLVVDPGGFEGGLAAVASASASIASSEARGINLPPKMTARMDVLL
jgi:hypothetical protein